MKFTLSLNNFVNYTFKAELVRYISVHWVAQPTRAYYFPLCLQFVYYRQGTQVLCVMIMEGKEKEKIEATILKYVEGVQEFNFDKAENSWHPQGLKIFYDSDSESLKTITMKQSRPSTKPSIKLTQSAEIVNIDFFVNTASVKLKWQVKTEEVSRTSIDYISLLKMGDEWKIVSKVYGIKDK